MWRGVNGGEVWMVERCDDGEVCGGVDGGEVWMMERCG